MRSSAGLLSRHVSSAMPHQMCNHSRITFHETFARFKVAVVIQQIYFRYVQGQTRDEHFRNFDGLVRALTAEALELAKQSGI